MKRLQIHKPKAKFGRQTSCLAAVKFRNRLKIRFWSDEVRFAVRDKRERKMFLHSFIGNLTCRFVITQRNLWVGLNFYKVGFEIDVCNSENRVAGMGSNMR